MRIDTLIRGGRLVDGTGTPWRYADVAVSGDRIAAVATPGELAGSGAGRVVDATGLIVAPGFVDLMSQSSYTLLHDGRSLSKLAQR
ncbi:MAG TPA: hypothetical protein VMU66_01550 [Gaiellales bacterium]|nr:hypothetical protein [Gaiellales bacterium]